MSGEGVEGEITLRCGDRTIRWVVVVFMYVRKFKEDKVGNTKHLPILLLRIYPIGMRAYSHQKTCVSVFPAAFFIMTQTVSNLNAHLQGNG